MGFTHAFITRPWEESRALAQSLDSLGIEPVIQAAFDFHPLDARVEQAGLLAEIESGDDPPLLVFSSQRAVAFGLPQLSGELVRRSRVAAIGPATAQALKDASITVDVQPQSGFTSESLLDTLRKPSDSRLPARRLAIILAAPGGRRKLLGGLTGLGWDTRMLLVYRREEAPLDLKALEKLKDAEGIISVWTSANSIKSLSQRLSPATWLQLCQGDWLVISKRLARVARAYGPAKIHVAPGPGNPSILAAIRGLL